MSDQNRRNAGDIPEILRQLLEQGGMQVVMTDDGPAMVVGANGGGEPPQREARRQMAKMARMPVFWREPAMANVERLLNDPMSAQLGIGVFDGQIVIPIINPETGNTVTAMHAGHGKFSVFSAWRVIQFLTRLPKFNELDVNNILAALGIDGENRTGLVEGLRGRVTGFDAIVMGPVPKEIANLAIRLFVDHQESAAAILAEYNADRLELSESQLALLPTGEERAQTFSDMVELIEGYAEVWPHWMPHEVVLNVAADPANATEIQSVAAHDNGELLVDLITNAQNAFDRGLLPVSNQTPEWQFLVLMTAHAPMFGGKCVHYKDTIEARCAAFVAYHSGYYMSPTDLIAGYYAAAVAEAEEQE